MVCVCACMCVCVHALRHSLRFVCVGMERVLHIQKYLRAV